MLETKNFKKSIDFKNNIAEICSISLECEYNVDEENIKGYFLIEGSYRSHEISINQDNFSHKVPFTCELPENVDEESVLLNVKDFTYNINASELEIDIEYDVTYEEQSIQEFKTDEEFERFIADHEVDIVDLKPIEEKIEEPPMEEEIEDVTKDDEEEEINDDVEDRNALIDSETIISNITSKEENFITYHIYICDEADTMESVAKRFNIGVDVLKNYNSVDNVEFGMKLIIPYVNE